jgi:hypothetical protein
MRGAAVLVLLLLAGGCTATHRLQVPVPVTGSETYAPRQTSATSLWGNAAKPLRAERCRGTNALSEVRAHTSFGDALLTVLTLGFRQAVSMDYLCAKAGQAEVEPIEP